MMPRILYSLIYSRLRHEPPSLTSSARGTPTGVFRLFGNFECIAIVENFEDCYHNLLSNCNIETVIDYGVYKVDPANTSFWFHINQCSKNNISDS